LKYDCWNVLIDLFRIRLVLPFRVMAGETLREMGYTFLITGYACSVKL